MDLRKGKIVETLFYQQKQNFSPNPPNNSRNPACHGQTKPATPPNGSLPTKLYIKLAKHLSVSHLQCISNLCLYCL